MRDLIPICCEPIFVEWTKTDAGFGCVTFTDETAQPFIGLYNLDRLGTPRGEPNWFPRYKFITPYVIGFKGRKPLVINVDVEVSSRGLSLIIYVPLSVAPHSYQRHTSALWGSAPPPYDFMPFLPSPRSVSHGSHRRWYS